MIFAISTVYHFFCSKTFKCNILATVFRLLISPCGTKPCSILDMHLLEDQICITPAMFIRTLETESSRLKFNLFIDPH